MTEPASDYLRRLFEGPDPDGIRAPDAAGYVPLPLIECDCTPEQHARMVRLMNIEEARLRSQREQEEAGRQECLRRWGPMPPPVPGQLLHRDSGGNRVYEGDPRNDED